MIAQQAKLMFQKIDKEITSKPSAVVPTPGPVRTPSDSRWFRASFGEAPKDVEVVHSNEPSYKEQVEIETAALSERYKVRCFSPSLILEDHHLRKKPTTALCIKDTHVRLLLESSRGHHNNYNNGLYTYRLFRSSSRITEKKL